MGLDMYLYAIPKIEKMNFLEILEADLFFNRLKKEEQYLPQKIEPNIAKCRELKQAYPSIVIELAYWQKANQIHNWFVNNVQNGQDDCMPYKVSKEQVQQLHKCCLEVLSKHNGSEILPTKPGFYFGSTAYDRYYYLDVEQTKNITADLLEMYDFNSYHLVYNSNW